MEWPGLLANPDQANVKETLKRCGVFTGGSMIMDDQEGVTEASGLGEGVGWSS